VLSGGLAANGVSVSDGLIEMFVGNGGNDTIDGGQGYDRADYNSAQSGVVVTLNDTLDGSASDGLGGVDVLRNIEGVRGSDFNDTLNGSDSAAFESFEGREGNDTIDGKNGVDRADYYYSVSGVNVNLVGGIGSDGYGSTDSLSNIENVRGSRDFNDVITGNSANNKLEGLGGADNLLGGEGNDTLIGGLGADGLYGGSGTDTLDYSAMSGAVTAELWRGSVLNDGSGSVDTFTGIENLIAGSGADLLSGDVNANRLDGGAGNDRLYGQEGNDTLIGGLGMDSLSGGGGSDTFDFNALLESLIGGVRDVISDFSSLQSDKIDLTTLDANTLVANDQAFSFIGNATFSSAAGELRFSAATLSGDVNGDGIADFEIQLTGVASMTVGDFIL